MTEDAETGAATGAKMMIPISKGTELFLEVDPNWLMDNLPTDALKEVLFQGLKQVLNRGQSKIGSSKGLEGKKLEENNKALKAKAEETYEAMVKGEIRVTGGKAKTKSSNRAVQAEAMRLARALVKDAIKREGKVKVSHVAAKEITAAAKEVLEGDYGPEIVAQAEATIKAREKEESKISGAIDLSSIKADPKLVKASEEKKAKPKKAPAGVVAKARPQAAQHAGH
jgi:hypothetical protein